MKAYSGTAEDLRSRFETGDEIASSPPGALSIFIDDHAIVCSKNV